jgi:ornithine carbamoyltransferase
MMKRDLVSFALWSGEDLRSLLDLTRRMKSAVPGSEQPLARKSAALIFERRSLRTRVSFEVGILQLGGHPLFLQQESIGMTTRESVHDIAQVLSHYTELIIARTNRHQTCAQLAESAAIPVINAMTDLLHPCQILADAFTLREANRFAQSTRIVIVGSGNNIANSWLELAEKIPLHIVISCPPGYEPHPQILQQAEASRTSEVELIQDPQEAVRGADVVYTDVWPRTGGEADEGIRVETFRPYQVNKALLKHAKDDCLVMHRLPARRGEEITSDVLDGPHSVALQQAENRLHVQKAIMMNLLERAGS